MYNERRPRWVAVYKLGIIAILLLTCGAFTFSQTGNIAGRVYNKATGQPVVGAIVRLDPPRLTVHTDARGNFSFRDIPPAHYHLSVRADFFRPWLKKNLRVQPGRTVFVVVPLVQSGDPRYPMPFFVPDSNIHYQ